jgi:hypothetical protein
LLTTIAGEGVFLVQDEASQLIAELAAAQPGERILDACASPGGKTTAMAARLANDGLIVATDIRGRRVDLLAQTIAAMGATRVRVVRADASMTLPFIGSLLLLGALFRQHVRRADPPHRPVMHCMRARVNRAVATGGGTARDAQARGRRGRPRRSARVRNLFERTRRKRTGHRRVPLVARRFPARARSRSSSLEPFRHAGRTLQEVPFRDGLEAFFAAVGES